MEWMRKTWCRLCAGIGTAIWAGAARAQLPEWDRPGDVDEGDFFGLLQAYGFLAVQLAGLLIGGVAFLIVCKNVISKYSQVSDGRATWGEVFVHAGVGVVVLAIVIWLAVTATGILDTSGS